MMRIVKAFFVLFCSILNTGMLYADNGTKQTLIESWQFRRDHDMNAEGGWQNEITVLLENKEQSSRWYPGAGLYRKVRLIEQPAIHVPVWGTCIRTPYVSAAQATITVTTGICGVKPGDAVTLETVIYGPSGTETMFS